MRSDFSLIWVPRCCGPRPGACTASNTPGGELVPQIGPILGRDDRGDDLAVGSPMEPEMPAIGVSDRRIQGEPTNRSRARAKLGHDVGLPGSGGATSVTRRCWISRRFGVPMSASGVRIGIRYSCQHSDRPWCQVRTPFRTKYLSPGARLTT